MSEAKVRAVRARVSESAGALMARAIAVAKVDETVGALRRRLPIQALEVVDPVCVVDEAQRLVGALGLVALVGAEDEVAVSALMLVDWPRVAPTTDRERAAALARERSVSAVPVVDAEGRLLGCVTALTLLDAVWHEHVEDLQRLAGIVHASDGALHALEDPPVGRFLRRLPWLLVGLGGSALATGVMARFEGSLAARVEIAYFVPAIVYLADAIGTQTEAVAVRGLSLSHRSLLGSLTSEVLVGVMIGVTLGGASGLLIWLFFGDPLLGVAVGLSLVAAGTVAAAVGLLLPWLLSRAGIDPAFGSGPVATVIQDVLSLLIYFVVIGALVL